MSSLINKTNNQIIANSVKTARGFLERSVGLLGKSTMPEDMALWIPSCKSIHTFFMKFPIDAIFVDKKLCVVSIFHSIPSSRVLFGGLKSDSVFEIKAGQLKKYNLNKGDQLYVGN